MTKRFWKMMGVVGLGIGQLTACSTQPLPSEQFAQVAVAGDNKEVARRLKAGQPVNEVAPQGTALTQAAAAGQSQVVLQLLRAGADPNLGVREGQASALHYAAAAGDLPTMRALVAAGIKLEQRDAEGSTPLVLTARNGDLPATKLLIKAGAKVNLQTEGRSLLMDVVGQDSLLIAQLLIKAGADVNFQSPPDVSGFRNSALRIAQTKRFADLEILLTQAGAH